MYRAILPPPGTTQASVPGMSRSTPSPAAGMCTAATPWALTAITHGQEPLAVNPQQFCPLVSDVVDTGADLKHTERVVNQIARG